MTESNLNKVWVFFYGTFMSAEVLQQHGIDCSITHPAHIVGFQLVIQPRVNLIQQVNGVIYGAVALVDQLELTTLYRKVQKQYSNTYYPYPVSAKLADGATKLALCFIAEAFNDGKAAPLYISEMIKAAKGVDAPSSYLSLIESFK